MKTKNTPALPAETRRVMRKMMRYEADLREASLPGAVQPTRFTLNLGQEIQFEFGPRAYFRMGTCDKPFDLTDCSNPKRSYAATVSWLWACLSREDEEQFEEPQDLASVIPFDRILDCTKAFIKAIADYNAARKADDKAKPAAVPANG